ncbi:hypothetical protein [Parapedobacter soli]|uniref:hypothetical protein n=1 Tax=Parapedobacter soli TaxID=416955 RepID=UPI0021CA9DDE|nr:hypothetical protein [Parapedobacter soli]
MKMSFSFPRYWILLSGLLMLLGSNCSRKSIASGDITDNELPGIPHSKVKFKDMLGVNAFEWNFGSQNNPTEDSRFFKPFSNVRHYLDWRQIESEKGKYGYNPTPRGGWKYDEIYEWCKANDITVLACIKTIPDWLLETYPEEKRDVENVPAVFGADLSDPASYIDFGKLAFQYAARYGSNQDVDPSLVHVEPVPHYNPNKKIIGSGLIQYIECNNEPDRIWKPTKVARQTPSEYAANLSAFYDGHQGELGHDVGVKNADPNMQVVMAGIATPDPGYVQEIIDWCEKYRGRKPDGTIDLCFDVINYHHYARNRETENNPTKQRGVAPELSNAASIAQQFVILSNGHTNSIPVWNTESGYDINQNSYQKAIPIKNKSALITQADWILRTSLLYARNGVSKLFFYMLHDVNANSTTQYMSSGFIDKESAEWTTKPSWNYLQQAKEILGEFYYQSTISDDPFVDKYVLDDRTIYSLVVPDEQGRSVDYELDLGNQTKQVKIYQLDAEAISAQSVITSVKNGKIKLTVTETPIFVELLR